MVLREFQSVIKLLDDNTPEVQAQVEKKILEFYFSISPEQWLQTINNQPQHLRLRLAEQYKEFNNKYFRLYFDLWSGLLTDKDHQLLVSLQSEGVNVEYENNLMFFLFLISRLLTPFLSYTEFKSFFQTLLDKFPPGFARNNTPLEQARYFVWLFYKWDRFYWTMEHPLWVSFDPYMTFKNRKGAGITIAIIMAAIAESLGLDWFVISDDESRASYLAIPVDKMWSVPPLLINTTTGVILGQVPQVISEAMIRHTSVVRPGFISVYYFLKAYHNQQFLPGNLYKTIGKVLTSLNKVLNNKF